MIQKMQRWKWHLRLKAADDINFKVDRNGNVTGPFVGTNSYAEGTTAAASGTPTPSNP